MNNICSSIPLNYNKVKLYPLLCDCESRLYSVDLFVARTQVDDLKKEIERVESDYRRQITSQEKKAHENWLAARQAEREMKDAKTEAQTLRQK